MSKETDFEKFLQNIEPSDTTKEYIASIQQNLRKYLESHELYKNRIIDSFLTGSYAKHTCIKPTKYDGKTDVDIIVVTNYCETDDSKNVLDELYRVCKEKYNNVTKQSRSIGIEMSGIEIDVVPMIKDNQYENLYKIGNKKDGKWKRTNPKGHISWCSEINKSNQNKFVRIMKTFKWWRKNNCPESRKYPKGITLEKIVADNLFDCNNTYEEIIFNTMKNIKEKYEMNIKVGLKPIIYDPGMPMDNLADSYEYEDFKSFLLTIENHIKLLENSDFSNDTWRKILGIEFPQTNLKNSSISNVIDERISNFFNVPYKKKPRWIVSSNVSSINVDIKCMDKYNRLINYNLDGNSILDKNINLEFSIPGIAAFSNDTKIYWQVVNTGEEAKQVNCLRGDFEVPNINQYNRHECTSYTGTHWVQAFIVKDNICIAKSKEVLVKVK